MNYQKPNKDARNASYCAMLQENGWMPEQEPYEEEQIEQNKKFLIVCEGLNTEKEYFKAFPVNAKTVIEVKGGFAGGKMYLINEAQKLSKKEEYQNHEIWCVFDFDVKFDNPKEKQDFDNAIKKGNRINFKMAFSNDAFELWFLLHYKLIQNQHHRIEYFEQLTEIWDLEHSYQSMGKQNDFCEGHYERLLLRQEQAINNAEILFNKVNDRRPFHKMNPCTTVFHLVRELNKYIRR